METMFDVQQLLKSFGAIIYTGNRSDDIVLMEDEIRELYDWKMIDVQTYQQALLILKKEKGNQFKLT